MPHTSRKRSSRGDTKAARFKRSSLGKADTTRNQEAFTVTVVWGADNLSPRTTVTTDRRKAMRIARSIAERGARIVLVKKGSLQDGYRLIGDFSTVGGAR